MRVPEVCSAKRGGPSQPPPLHPRTVRAIVLPRQACPLAESQKRPGQELPPDWHTFLLAGPEHLTPNVHLRPLA